MATQIQQAWQLFQAGLFKDALIIAETICNSDGADAASTYLRGCCLSALDQHSDALNSFEQSLSYEPFATHVYMAMGSALAAQNKLNDAAGYYKKILLIDPSHLNARVAIARVLTASGMFDAARKHLQSAKEYSPNSGLPHYELGNLGRQSKLPAKEICLYFTTAATLEPGIAQYQFALGECLLNQERYDEARDCFYKAFLIDPDNPTILSGLASVSVKQGNMDFALEQIKKLQNRRIFMPDVAITFLLCCKHGNRCDTAIEYAQTCLSDTKLDPDTRRNIHSKLASVLDNRKQYDKAWQHLVASKSNIDSNEKYTPLGYKLFIDHLIETFNSAGMFNLPQANIKQTCSPIFIVGMPRSGTSLVEQILAAHPEVTGGGELTYIQSIVDNFPRKIGSSARWPFCIRDASQQDINSLAQHYLVDICRLADSTPYVTDKMPHNFMALGLIRLLFPEAKIIHCTRQYLDTCISIYFQKFKEGHPYSKNLSHLGTHYHQYQRIMNHWKASLSFNMFEMPYEDLVQNPKQVINNLLDYCDLEWNDNCLKFNEVKRYVLTASFDQIRQPLHTHSVNRWQHYEQYLDDLKEGFKRGF